MALHRSFVCLGLMATIAAAASPAHAGLVLTGGVFTEAGDPLARARVELVLALPRPSREIPQSSGESPAPVATGESDARGRFRLVAPAPGAFEVVARSAGGSVVRFGPFLLTRSRELPPFPMPRAGETALPASPGSSADAEISRQTASPPKATSGRVLDLSTGKGIRGALIAPAADLGSVVTTGERGVYRMPALPAGGATLEVHAVGFLPRRVRVSVREIATGRIPSLGLEREARVTGRVLGPEGEPLAAVSVEAVHESLLASRPLARSERPSDRTVTGADGSFTLAGLRTLNRYEVRARKAGFLPAASAVATPGGVKAAKVELRLQATRSAIGRVTDPEDTPLVNARVILRPSRREGRGLPDSRTEKPLPEKDLAVVRSDRTGRFLVAAIPAAQFDLEIDLPGYSPTRRAGFVAGKGDGALDLGTVVLQPGAALAGQVLGSDGEVVARARLFLFDRAPTVASLLQDIREREPDAETDAQGGFRLDDLPVGARLDLAVVASGFVPHVLRGARPPTEKPLVIRLELGLQVVGRVLDEQDEGIPGARISLSSQRPVPGDPYERPLGQRALHDTTSDDEGRFLLEAVPDGRLSLSVSAEGFLARQGAEVEVPADGIADPIVVRLRAGAALWGQVATVDGDPVPEARVVSDEQSTTTDAEGRYRLSGLPEGELEVEVRHPHYRRFTKTVRVEPGESRLDLELPAGVSVAGAVVGSSGEPVAGAEVVLRRYDRQERQEYRTRTEVDGSFRLDPVATGIYHLEAASSHSRRKLPRPIVVEEPIQDLEVVLGPGAVVMGEVRGLAPEELAAVEVEARADDGRVERAWLDAAGTYRIEALDPGRWLLRAAAWQGQKEARARLVVEPDDRELRRDLEFDQGVSLSGRVLFEDEPLAHATLSMRGQRLAIERSAVTSFDGRFHLENLEPDVYRLGVSRPDLLLVHNQWLELNDDREVEIHLSGAAVSGVVRDAEGGDPVAGAWIRLSPTEGPDFLILDTSQSDGSFHLLRVPPGTHRLSASADGFVAAQREIHVQAGSAVEGLELLVSPTEGGLVQVTHWSGAVPAQVHLMATDAAGTPVVAETRSPGAEGLLPLPTLPSGTWQLLLSAPGAATVAQAITVPGPTRVVVLPPADDLHLQVPSLGPTDLLATVTLFGADQQPFWSLGPGGTLSTIWPMAAGKAHIPDVPQGTWLVLVESADGRTWTGSVTTPGTAETTAILE